MKKPLLWTLSFLFVASLLYAGLWIFSYKAMTEEIDRVYADAPAKGYEFLGTKPVVTGFPFTPKIYYGGGFKIGNTLVLFQEAWLKGFPIPGLTFTLDVPRGLAIDGIVNPNVWAIDTLKADIVIPRSVPGDYHFETLSQWQQAGGQFDLRHFEMTRQALKVDGQGHFKLDETLQPELSIESSTRGYESFVQELMAAGIVPSVHAAAATGVLNSMAKQDEVTKENVATLTITVKNRLLSVGPLQVVRLPEIVWDRRMTPVQPQ